MNEPVTYSGYLRLDQLLSAQQPRSSEHDEMLFIVIHQIYELWFKQLLHELGKLQSELESGGTTHAMRTLRRTLAVLKIVVAQLDVLETMTPTQFTRFRDWLGTSSGFDRGGELFDTPSLVELWRTAPYLHDGSAATIRDVLTTRNVGDRHGRTSDLNNEQMDDLVQYLLSL